MFEHWGNFWGSGENLGSPGRFWVGFLVFGATFGFPGRVFAEWLACSPPQCRLKRAHAPPRAPARSAQGRFARAGKSRWRQQIRLAPRPRMRLALRPRSRLGLATRRLTPPTIAARGCDLPRASGRRTNRRSCAGRPHRRDGPALPGTLRQGAGASSKPRSSLTLALAPQEAPRCPTMRRIL